MSHRINSDECELEEHENCPGAVECEDCNPRPIRPCNCFCHTTDYEIVKPG